MKYLPVALVRRLYDSKVHPAVTREIMAPDIVWDITLGFPSGGVYYGYDSMMNDFFGALLPRTPRGPSPDLMPARSLRSAPPIS